MLAFALVWDIIGIQSPFLIFCGYPLLERRSWIASPVCVYVSVSLCSCLLFYEFESVPFAFYWHFLIGGGLFLICYSWLLVGWRYSATESVALSALTLIACDELWQMPFNILNWTHSLLYAEIGLATAGFDLMSLPLIGYFLLRFRKPVALNQLTMSLLMALIGLTSFETARFYSIGFPTITSTYPPFEPYYLIFPWLAFFLLLFRPCTK